MFNWLYNCIEKKFNEERINRWICAGAVEGLKDYFNRYGRYPEYVVDIGAHHGALSKDALEHGAIKVIAIEASKDNYKKLIKNLSKLENEANTICINNAFFENPYSRVSLISNKRGNSGQKSLLYVINGNKNDYIIERCLTIDRADLVNMTTGHMIDYLKIDIEGNEFCALPFDDATRKLFAKTRFLDIELHSLDNPNFFDKQAFLDLHPDYDPAKDMIVQFVEFLGTCGFHMPEQDISGKGAVKLLTANKNFERIVK